VAAAQPSGKAVADPPSYLHPAEVADILHVSPKTVSRWAKEGKLPFLKTLGATAATQRPRSASWPRASVRKQPPKGPSPSREKGRSGSTLLDARPEIV
jgi:excisionase family DNA binding protein